jgi:hypothetical protein
VQDFRHAVISVLRGLTKAMAILLDELKLWSSNSSMAARISTQRLQTAVD